MDKLQNEKVFDELMVWKYFKRHLKNEIDYNHLSESFIVAFVQAFRRDGNMSTARLDVGINLLREAIRIQYVKNIEAGPVNQMQEEELNEVIKRVDGRLQVTN